jgi:hypothetical protein
MVLKENTIPVVRSISNHGPICIVVKTSRSFSHSRLITGCVTILPRRVPLVEQELLILPEHLSSPPGFSGVRVTRSLVLYVYFVDRCLSFFFWPLCCLFFFDMRILIAPLVYSNSSNESSTSFRKAVWLYNQGNYPIFRDLISNTNWKSTVSEQPNVYIAYELLTGKFLKIADECIRPNTVIIRRNDKIWMTYEIRRKLRVGDR